MISELKKEFNNNSSKIHKKQNTNKNIEKYLNELKNSENSKKMEQLKQPIIIDDTEYETYSFKPEINQRSINLCKKKFKKRKDSSPLNKTVDISDKYIESHEVQKEEKKEVKEEPVKQEEIQEPEVKKVEEKVIPEIKEEKKPILESRGDLNEK